MDVFIAVAAILSVSLFFVVRFKLNSAAAPFLTMVLIIVWLCVAGMLNILVPGILAVYLFAAFGLYWVFVVKKVPLKEILAVFFTPATAFFVVSSLVFFVALRSVNPFFIEWDEFSFWGFASKVVFTEHRLYTFVPTDFSLSYPPALPVWNCFVQFLSSSFSEWKTYFAYDILTMSVMTLLFARVRWKQFLSILALVLFGFFALYIFWWTFDSRLLYCTTYGDIPLGIVFGGCVLSYFMAGENPLMKWLTPLLGIAALAFVKDTGMALGLIAAAIIGFDIVWTKGYPFSAFFSEKKRILRAVFPLVLLLAAVLPYLVWNLHYSIQVQADRTPVAYAYSAWEVLTGKDPYFVEMVQLMTQALFKNQLVTFGTVFEMCVVFTLIPIVFGLLTFDKKRFVRLALFSLLLLGSFLTFYYFHAYLYTTVFTFSRSHEMYGYGRYLSSHAIGWFVASAGICFSDAAQIVKPKWLNLKPASILAVFAALSNLLFLNLHPDQYVFISQKIQPFLHPVRQEIQDSRAAYGQALRSDDRVYFICQGTAGAEFFFFQHDFFPIFTIQPYGKGTFVSPDTPDDEMPAYTVRADRDLFLRHLRTSDADFVYILQMDWYFFEEFGPLFSDHLTGAADKSCPLYLVLDNGGDDITLVPAQNEQHLAALRQQYNL